MESRSGAGAHFHHRGACEASDHEAEQMQLQIVRSGLVGCARLQMFGKANHEAGDAHLRPDIKELRDNAPDEMGVPPRLAQLCPNGRIAVAAFANLRQAGEINHRGDGEEIAAMVR